MLAHRRLKARVLAGLLATSVATCVVPAAAGAATTLAGSVTSLADGGAISGAYVSAAGVGASRPAAVLTGADGAFTIEVPGNAPYSMAVQADGYAGQSVGGIAAGAAVPVELGPSELTPLPLDAGPIFVVEADATSGIFYGLASMAPEMYRSDDYGGTWRQVTSSFDDADTGLANSYGVGDMSASSVPGEVAVAPSGSAVSYSTDFGMTWHRIGGDYPQMPPGASTELDVYWAHARDGAPNVMILAKRDVAGAWTVWRADMSAASPAFVKEPADPLGTGSVIDFADSAEGSFIGRVDAAGHLSFAPVSASEPIVFGADQATFPTPPLEVRLGGRPEASAPPDGVLVVSVASPYSAQMITKAAGADTFAGGSMSSAAALPEDSANDCQAGIVPGGTVAPTTTGADGSGNAGKCWLTKTGTDLVMTPHISGTGGAGIQGDLAYDAHWASGNNVIIARGHAGPHKSASIDSQGVPVFPIATGAPGEDPATGGFVTNGIHNPIVTDTAFGPAGLSQVAIATMDMTLASTDGGATMNEVVQNAHTANGVAWWQGASGSWLVFVHDFDVPCTRPITAALDWNGATLPEPNVAGTSCTDLGGPDVPELQGGGYGISAVTPVPGTDSIFFGTSATGQVAQGGTRNHLYRARLVPGSPPSLADKYSFDAVLGSARLDHPTALAYCPADSAFEAARDVLFVATEHQPSNGSLLRITGATTASPVVTQVDSVPATPVYDVRADCAGGRVYAGGLNMLDNGALYVSADGGVTFTRTVVPGVLEGTVLAGDLTAIGLNPANGLDVKVAGGMGAMAHSTDGGATWTVISDPSTARPMRVSDIEYPPAGATRRRAMAAAAATGRPVVGSDSGAFRADLSASVGLIAMRGSSVTTPEVGVRMTNVATDQRPATAGTFAVFHRNDGLWATNHGASGWSPPLRLPVTRAGDDFAGASADSAGQIHVAFTRSAAPAGVYVTTLAGGAWRAPVRIGTHSGDALPAIASSGKRVDVAFVRTTGRSRARGVYVASLRNGAWGKAKRVRGTGAADARTSAGGPALTAAGTSLHLVFARASGRYGIYAAVRKGVRWGKLQRLTRRRGEADPAIVLDARRAERIVFRRSRGVRGLYAITRGRKVKAKRVTGSGSRDRAPTLLPDGTNVLLAFARVSGGAPGIRLTQASASGRWSAKPGRWSFAPGDATPALRVDTQHRINVLFTRG